MDLTGEVAVVTGGGRGLGLACSRALAAAGASVLVTNAGILRDTVRWKMTDDDFDDVVRVHLRGTFTCAASDASAAITGQAIGVGGDRLALWAHPQEKKVELRDGGWNADEIAAAWAEGVGAQPESSGIAAPQPTGN